MVKGKNLQPMPPFIGGRRERGGQPWSRTSVSDDRRLAGPVGMQRSDGSPALGQTCVPARLVRSRPRPLFLWAGPNSLTHYFPIFQTDLNL
jgi:hypothetical protein